MIKQYKETRINETSASYLGKYCLPVKIFQIQTRDFQGSSVQWSTLVQLFIDKKNLKKMKKKKFIFILYLPVREKTFSQLLLKIIFLYIPEREKVFLLCDHLLKIKQKKQSKIFRSSLLYSSENYCEMFFLIL